MRVCAALFLFFGYGASSGFAQSGSGTAGLAGVGAGAALGAAAGQSSTTPSSVGGGSTPVEIEIMAFHGLRKIATEIATLAEKQGWKRMLVEDPASANQIALYQAVNGYYNQLSTLHRSLQNSFPMVVTPASVTFPAGVTQGNITVTNKGDAPLTVGPINILPGTSADANTFRANSCAAIPPNGNCVISVTFNGPQPVPGRAQTLQATMTITGTMNVQNADGTQRVVQSSQVVQLVGVVPAQNPLTLGERQQLESLRQRASELSEPLAGAPIIGPIAPLGGSGAGSSSSTTPIGLTYLSNIMTALGGLKNGITYSPSSFQPTTQAFEVMVERELSGKGIEAYTSTSALDLSGAANSLASTFGAMLSFGSDISNWTNKCSPPATTQTPNAGVPANPPPVFSSDCSNGSVVVNLAVAAQMMTGYTSLLQASSDAAGNPVIVDVLRGKILSDALKHGIPSVQVSVAAAGGSTRANSIFLLNLFYTPKPSYDSGVIAIFELRDKDNKFVDGGARTVLFDYTSTRKLRPDPFKIEETENKATCGSFCRDKRDKKDK